MDALPNNGWRDKLRDAVEKSGRSRRDISIKAGLGHGYIHDLLTTKKRPNIDNLSAVAAQLNVSVTELLA